MIPSTITVLVHVLEPKLSTRDRLVMSTVCRDIYSTLSMRAHTHIDAVLPTTSHVISFGLWMQQHARELRSVSINSTVVAGASTIYMCGQCPNLMACDLTFDRFETFGFHFLWMLHDLHIDISHCTDGRVSLATTTFPLLNSLVIENHTIPTPRRITLPDAHRKTVALPDALPTLTQLLVRHAFVESMSHMPMVQDLALPSCRFGADMVLHMATLTTLTSLDLSQNALRFIPEELSALAQLRHLDVSRNDITNYDDDGSFVDDTFAGIEPLTSLTSLSMHHNHVDTLGFEDAIPRLRCSLRHLDIACNPCADFPITSSLRHLTSLRTSSLPGDLHRMTTLAVLYIHGHCGAHHPYEEHAVPSVTPPTSLQAVYIEDHDITTDTMGLIATFPSSVVRVDTWNPYERC